MLQPMKLDASAAYQRNDLLGQRPGTGLPRGYGLKQIKLLGKGSNNAVYLYKTKAGQKVIVRQPRRRSDTQKLGNATWEFRNTAIAAEIGAAPALYDAWYVRHTSKEQRGGLHVLCEFFPMDVHAVLIDAPARALPLAHGMREIVARHLRAMADASLLCYDLKPSNMVMTDDPIDVRFIDFGRDFCEWRPYSATNEYLERAPVLSFVQTLADQHASADDEYKPTQLYADLIYASMVVVLSANIGFTLDESKKASRQAHAANASLNFMSSVAQDLRAQLRGKHVALLKQVIRQRDIRDTLRHYMGRRNCGTKRCFQYASFM